MGMAAILVMWPGRQEHLNKLSFPHSKESPYEIWVQLAQWFQRRRCLKMLTDGPTTDAGVTGILIAHLGAFGSGELKNYRSINQFTENDQWSMNLINWPTSTSN